jgi:putative membrane protein
MVNRASTPPGHADYRFLLANERTFLAYVRTAVALHVAGFGVLQFLTHSQDLVREGFGLAMVAAGSFVGVVGYRRFRSNEATIRAEGDLQTARSPVVLAVAVGALPLLAALLITFG